MAPQPHDSGSLLASARNFCATLLTAAALTCSLAAHAGQSLTGRVSVIDGDTIDMHGTRLRLHGIDAPESNQACTTTSGQQWRCGQQSALALDKYIAGRPLRCEQRDMDRYGRVVAECFLGQQSVNRWMVRQGWAVAYEQYSRAYVGDQQQAQQSRLNIWSGTFETPADHRRGAVPPQQPGTAPPDPACPLKGNINRRGDRIYHAPGQADYDRTVINTADGERWFCSHEEATTAGWRPARR